MIIWPYLVPSFQLFIFFVFLRGHIRCLLIFHPWFQLTCRNHSKKSEKKSQDYLYGFVSHRFFLKETYEYTPPLVAQTSTWCLQWRKPKFNPLGLGRSPGQGNGNPLQCSRLENSMDRGAWWATVHGVTKSRTRLNNFSFTFPLGIHIWKLIILFSWLSAAMTNRRWEWYREDSNINNVLLVRFCYFQAECQAQGIQLWVNVVIIIPILTGKIGRR